MVWSLLWSELLCASNVIYCDFFQLLDWINKTLPWLEDRKSEGTLDDMQV